MAKSYQPLSHFFQLQYDRKLRILAMSSLALYEIKETDLVYCWYIPQCTAMRQL